MSPAAHRIGAAIVVAIGLFGAFGGVLGGNPQTASAESAVATSTSAPGPRLTGDAAALIEASAAAMVEVKSVRFQVSRTGAPVYIDAVEELALDAVVGRFEAPANADALVTVTVSGDLATELGAVALGPDIWLSNPITGEFEPLPPSYDIDPSRFFDPTGGWHPLLVGLIDLEIVRDDDVIHLRGTAPESELRTVTAGLVRADDVVIDLWLDPYSGLVERVEFSVDDRNGVSHWTLVLSDYGASFTIAPPPGVDR